jgi:hypothetical protein
MKMKLKIKRKKHKMNYKRNNIYKVFYLLKLIQLIIKNKLKLLIINRINQ